MARKIRVREALSRQPGPDYWNHKVEEGWRLVAVEWEREAAESEAGSSGEEVPYGLQVAEDCEGLEEHPEEMRTLTHMLDLIADDSSLSEVAAELNRRGFRSRGGAPWTQMSVFYMLPRLIEAAPRIRSGEEWGSRRAG